jgi:putative flippase GtrA
VNSILRHTFPRFLSVGVINTLFGVSVIFALKWVAGFPDALSNLLGYVSGLMASFLLNKRWTFRFQGGGPPLLIKFGLVTAVAYLLNLSVVLFLIHVLQINGYFSQLIGVVPYTVVSYLGCRHFVFVEDGRGPEGNKASTLARRDP